MALSWMPCSGLQLEVKLKRDVIRQRFYFYYDHQMAWGYYHLAVESAELFFFTSYRITQ